MTIPPPPRFFLGIGALTLLGCASAPVPSPKDATRDATAAPTDADEVEAPSGGHRVHVAGSRLSFTLPDGWSRIPHVAAFHHAASNSAIALAEADGNDDVARGMLASVEKRLGPGARRAQRRQHGLDATYLAADNVRALIVSSAGHHGTVYVKLGTPEMAGTADEILSSVELDPSAPFDSFQVIGIRMPPPEGMEKVAFSPVPAFREPPTSRPGEQGVGLALAFVPLPAGFTDESFEQAARSAMAKNWTRDEPMPLEGAIYATLPALEAVLPGKPGYVVYGVALRANTGMLLVQAVIDEERVESFVSRIRTALGQLELVPTE